jgi:hypothetical protein
MTKKTISIYPTFIVIAVALAMSGAITASASEVTGTLSSDTSNDSGTTGTLGGTVSDNSSGSNGSNGGSSRSSRNNGSGTLLDAATGTVLGASTDNVQAPRFPNAGFAPNERLPQRTVWSTLVGFLRNTISY